MDPSTILDLLDGERSTGADVTGILETAPNVIRSLSTNWSGITYSRFSVDEADQMIDREIRRFTDLDRDFEWKVCSHDQPPICLPDWFDADLRWATKKR
jgi:hypothetical protein